MFVVVSYVQVRLLSHEERVCFMPLIKQRRVSLDMGIHDGRRQRPSAGHERHPFVHGRAGSICNKVWRDALKYLLLWVQDLLRRPCKRSTTVSY